jgi:hypothetical protein
MSLNRRRRLGGVLLISAGFLCGCAATTLQSVQRAPDFNARQVRRVLVVCATKTPGLRSLLESEFVRQWKSRGVDASASAQVLPSGVTLDKMGIAAAAKAQGFDAVLVTRLIQREQIEAQTPENARLTQDVNALVASPEYGMDYEVARVSANLYDAFTEKRVWSGITQTLVTGGAPRRVRSYVKLILKTLYEPAR